MYIWFMKAQFFYNSVTASYSQIMLSASSICEEHTYIYIYIYYCEINVTTKNYTKDICY